MNCDLLEHKQLLICASGITSKVTDTWGYMTVMCK
jgi:hypothetical protein